MKLLALSILLAMTTIAQKPLVEGKKDSPVRVVIYEDLQCSDCAVFGDMLDRELLPKYASKVAFEHHDFPLAKHLWARQAALVARYLQFVGEEKALAFRRQIMAKQKQVTVETFADWVRTFCSNNGLDGAKALEALNDAHLQALIQKDFDVGTARGIARTPTALVNGEPFIETFTAAEISAGIEKALKENNLQ